MIIETRSGQSFDTETDLTAPERHILQKLFLWKSLASDLEQFHSEKEKAFARGWNDSGPIQMSLALKSIVSDLEKQLTDRLLDLS